MLWCVVVGGGAPSFKVAVRHLEVVAHILESNLDHLTESRHHINVDIHAKETIGVERRRHFHRHFAQHWAQPSIVGNTCDVAFLNSDVFIHIKGGEIASNRTSHIFNYDVAHWENRFSFTEHEVKNTQIILTCILHNRDSGRLSATLSVNRNGEIALVVGCHCRKGHEHCTKQC